jgi:hypothetical protein
VGKRQHGKEQLRIDEARRWQSYAQRDAVAGAQQKRVLGVLTGGKISERTIAWWRAHRVWRLAKTLTMTEARESRAGKIADERHKDAMDAWFAGRCLGPMPDWNRIRKA